MTPPEPTQLDIVTVAVVLITALAGGEVARYAGPYLVIVVAALIGSYFALQRRPEFGVWRSLSFVAAITALAVLATGAASIVAAAALGRVGIEVQAHYLLVPIAGGIAWVGPDWPEVGDWAGGLLKRWAARKVDGGGS